jgi:formylglycine-generating enzyme required for sulfatase activity/serine/threonine protein kinase
MTNDPALDRAALSLSALRRIDERSARFEMAWRAGEAPDLTDFMDGVAEPERSALFRELLLSELEIRSDVDAPMDEADCRARFPTYGEIIRAVFAELEKTGSGFQDDLGFLQPSVRPASLGRLGHYEVLQVLGKGGFGVVLRAFDEDLQRVVAIKVLFPQLATTSPARKRFLREARTAAGIHHDNVVQIYAVQDQPTPYLVMEYISGETLQQRLDRSGPFEVMEVLRIGQLIANGLAAAHIQGLVHRDIKPGNILLGSDVEQRVKISDFGLARTADDASLTQSGVIAGTPLYMAPEQAQGEVLDQRADLFSFGSVLYVMCTGRPPFRASSTVAVLKRVVEDTPRPIREIIPEVPQGLVDIITKLHAKKAADRFQTAKEVADLLGRYRTELQGQGHIREERQLEPVLAVRACDPRSSEATEFRRPVFGRLSWLKLTAGVLLLALAALSLTEATGLTAVSARVVRLFAPEPAPIGIVQPADAKHVLDKKIEPVLANAPFDAVQARAHQEAWATFLDTKAFTINSIGMKFALIPPGAFLMGSPDDEPFRGVNEGPIREVRLTKPFALGVNAVTVGQFRTFVKEADYRTEAESSGLGALVLKENTWEMDANANWHNPGIEQSDDHPVTCISWSDAKAFCAWLSEKEHKKYALPTEARWEYACRAGSQSRFFFGDHEGELSDHVWYQSNADRRTHPVGEKKPNAWGLHDMHGNVWQWVADWHLGSYYARAQRDNPPGPNMGEYRALRGGDWSCGPEQLRSAYRGYHNGRNSNGGFRVACELSR